MNQATAKSILDVRSIEPGKRNSMVFNSFEELNPGESLQLINDQDTAPLHFQFLREKPYQFSWKYMTKGPDTWEVAITKKSSSF